MQALEKTIMATGQVGEQEGTTTGTVRESIGAVEATFLEHMLRVCMALPSGYFLVEAVAAERTDATWKAVVDERRKALGAAGLYPGQ
jgi:hypothetical protein